MWMDVTDLVDYNLGVLNKHDLSNCFFGLSRDDPTYGFAFDAASLAGHPYPKDYQASQAENVDDPLIPRLRLGSHLALYIRHQLEEKKGYTCTVGIATSKLLSKLVGNLNKPKGQTTIMPPYVANGDQPSNVTTFIDSHDIGKIPGLGFKLAQKLREVVLQRPAEFEFGLVYGGTKERVTVHDVRTLPDVNAEMLENLLRGPGSPHGIGYKVWCLLHGVDDTEVNQARPVPRQISQEDSYIRLDTMPELLKELTMLATSLITRMRIDLLTAEDEDNEVDEEEMELSRGAKGQKKWLAHPKTLRLTTRPRQPLQPDGTRVRSFKRISHSGPLPTFVFNLTESVDSLAEKLVQDPLISMFRRLHPEKAGWNLSLVNIAVTNMAETAGESRTANGRDIGNMFRRQEDVLKDFRVMEEENASPHSEAHVESPKAISGGVATEATSNVGEMDIGTWDDGEDGDESSVFCEHCNSSVPSFAMLAHQRYHELGD